MPAILRVTGEPGIGKTLFTEHVLAESERRGWLTIATACHEIQRHTPFLVANRLILAALQSLGSASDRYTSGLEARLAMLDSRLALRFGHTAPAAIDKAGYQEILLRFFDGIGTDHKIILACDDVQWIDSESRDALTALAANHKAGPLAFVFTERSSPDSLASRPPAGTIVLEPFDALQSAELVRSRYPAFEGISLETIVQHGNGNPFEILTLCEDLAEGDVVAGATGENRVRDVIANRVQRMETEEREFLQICSLLGEPIEYRMLFGLYAPGQVALLVSGRARPYLMPEGPALRFRHALVADAVRGTIDFDVPLRRRIIAALKALKEPTFSDYERIAEHAIAIGDVQLTVDTLTELSDRAFAQRAWTVVVKACDSILQHGPVEEGRFLKFYVQYTLALRSSNDDERACAILFDAVNKARSLRLEQGMGILVSALMAALWARGKSRQAIDVGREYIPTVKSESDRSEILALAMHIAASSFDDVRFNEEQQRFSAAANPTDFALAISHMARAFFHSYHADYDRASADIDLAIASADVKRRQDDTLAFAKLLIDYRGQGCTGTDDRVSAWLANNRVAGKDHDFGTVFRAWIAVAEGDWDLALTLVGEALLAGATPAAQIQLLTIPAMISALTNEPSAYEEQIESISSELRDWQSGDAALQLAPWYLMRRRNRELEQVLDSAVTTLAEQPPSPIAFGFVPLGIALFAHQSGKTAWLKIFASSPHSKDRAPWSMMHWRLAQGVALQALKDGSASSALLQAAENARALGAPFFGAYAAFRAGAPAAHDLKMLTRLRLSGAGSTPPHSRHGLTSREWDVVRLVGDGKSNREIAEELVLSERTVERHLGNVFDKLQLESRAKLMRWYFENGSDAIAE